VNSKQRGIVRKSRGGPNGFVEEKKKGGKGIRKKKPRSSMQSVERNLLYKKRSFKLSTIKKKKKVDAGMAGERKGGKRKVSGERRASSWGEEEDCIVWNKSLGEQKKTEKQKGENDRLSNSAKESSQRRRREKKKKTGKGIPKGQGSISKLYEKSIETVGGGRLPFSPKSLPEIPGGSFSARIGRTGRKKRCHLRKEDECFGGRFRAVVPGKDIEGRTSPNRKQRKVQDILGRHWGRGWEALYKESLEGKEKEGTVARKNKVTGGGTNKESLLMTVGGLKLSH